MPIIKDRQEVLKIYDEAQEKGWVIPCFCSENLTTTEAILAAAKDYALQKNIPDLPVIVAITVCYDHRTQAAYYTHTAQWKVGLKLFLADLNVLTEAGSPYENLRVLLHLDHIQFDDDQELLTWDMSEFSSIMFDASKVDFEQNVRLTREFVRAFGNDIVIEGACDEIMDAEGEAKSELTTPEHAEYFWKETGVDLIVANLGTEHRASNQVLKYHGDMAAKIKAKVGTRLVLHGASSVPGDQIKNLLHDGVCKVNLWTALERDSSPFLLTEMVRHADKVAGANITRQLIQQNFLGEAASSSQSASLQYFTTVYRQTIIFEQMKKIVAEYLELWYC